MGNRIYDKLANRESLDASPIFVFAADPLCSGGMRGLGTERGSHPRTHPEFLQLCRDITAEGFIDGLLMTPRDAEVLAVQEGLFGQTDVTPMVRMNAETNIWNPRHGSYRANYSAPFQTIPVTDARYCRVASGVARDCKIGMGLYSITLNNDVEKDQETLNAYLRFAREVADTPDLDHVLEVFLPNVRLPGMDEQAMGEYAADSIVRTMAYLRSWERPRFIKTAYTTPDVWRDLCNFDPTMIIGALGGARQNARGTLQLAHDVVKYGGRIILFGRAVFEEDDPLLICKALRAVLDGTLGPDDAHAQYQSGLRAQG
ncbi:MAG: hypothetical protein COZ06_27265 [Armatimonadetes bacterium CG_4_10_14_3_um_filter_66_18]|nr:hypothetical protein [Armatimonadota bacterium]OIP10838.1 MAG: hypothetical protein AUJ96_03230 [Armatimonadetes bacterium CG2_30_66_41]PIU90891.1 MAG: hypothetical protein COS65_23810 [Armatimonadetes bacterium CG06_land_8_20_14_3_00_66_21]PIW13510.1 MAG: hypothetical protein COW34_09160 [Armatimonadetes bacterium CG17_big_fil_post_rev_8_21_14_2_50_66_6]PIX38082.1 MAG: hypothetical protein COZ57_31465 [Armatimonadetes bacterium CG_4_8_14_3_um_filter_66_20]PIY41019.1 MAG: hypothetical prote